MNKQAWTIIRTATFYLIGLMNTIFTKPENIGTWENYAGYFFLLLAVVDTFFIVKKFILKRKSETVN